MSAIGIGETPKYLFSVLIYALILFPNVAEGQGGLLDELEEDVPCTAELIAEVSAFQPGLPFEVGVWVKPIPGWHGYWHSPRDGGDPPEVFWNLPDGWKISEPLFPAPERMVEPGGLIAYGYKKPFMLLFTATPPQESAEKEVKQVFLEANVTWQVCKTTCIYGESAVKLPLKSAAIAEVNPESRKSLRGWQRSVPMKKAPKGFIIEQEWVPEEGKGAIAGRWTIRWARKGNDYRPAIPVRWQVYPHALVAGLLDEAAPERWNPDPKVHNGVLSGNQVTFIVRDVGQGFHPGLLGATMVPNPGKAKGPVSGYPAFECRGEKPAERTGSD
ncbi:hypothetical protein CBD41_07880 [bacterium TMED181]|nr:hypothetical protein [Planctomycetota bacterium]OUW43080.1 MAG: hypothetical protein CBD41_07880 [bacterium TMED181]